MFKRNNNASNDIISSKLENIIMDLNKNNKSENEKRSNLHSALKKEIETIYLPAIENFKKLLEKYNIISEIERDSDDTAEYIEFRIFTEIEKNEDEDSEEYEGKLVPFYIICYFSDCDNNGKNIEKPIILEDGSGYKSSDPNHIPINECYNLNELSQDIINEKLLEFFKEIKITKTAIKIIE
jgi:hypothetical protein